MRIPNINAAAGFAGITGQSARETSESNRSTAASAEASRQSETIGQVEDVSESQQAGDRDAQEKYEGPNSRSSPIAKSDSSGANSDRVAPSAFDLPVADDSPPPALDTQA